MPRHAVAPKTDPNRPKSDFYPTLDPNVTIALCQFLRDEAQILLPQHTVWEPACGQGHMARDLKLEGFRVRPTNLENMGYGAVYRDFLSEPPVEDYDWIITNPPFSLSVQFIERAHHFGKPFAFLLKSQYWHAAARHPLFTKCRPKFILPLTWRPNFYPGERRTGAPTMDVLWCVWDGNKTADRTEFVPLQKPSRLERKTP